MNKFHVIVLLVLVAIYSFCIYNLGYSVAKSKQPSVVVDRTGSTSADPAYIAAVCEWYNQTKEPTLTPTPKIPEPDVKSSSKDSKDATVVYVYLDQDSKVVSVEVYDEPQEIAPGDSYEETDAQEELALEN